MNIIVLSRLHGLHGLSKFKFSRKLKIQAISTAIMVVASFLTAASPAQAYPMNMLLMDGERAVQSYTVPNYDYTSVAMMINRDNFEVIKVNGWAEGYYQGDIVEYARTFVGKVAYSANGTTPESGFDCSGFLQFLYSSSQGIYLPHSADTQAAMGKRIPANKAKPGDWVWWPNQHIGLYVGNGKMIDAPRRGQMVDEHEIWGKPIYIRFNG